jgi:hypothetical protein
MKQNTFNKFVGHPLTGFIGTIASVVSLILIFVGNAEQRTIALGVIILFLAFLLVQVYLFIHRYLNAAYPQGIALISHSTRYSSEDGTRWNYEILRNIQCKEPFQTFHEYRFKWTGSKILKVYSHTHPIASLSDFITPARNTGDYDILHIPFAQPVWFNDVVAIHIGMELDDAKHESAPYLSHKLDKPLQFLELIVELRHKSTMPNAILKRRRIWWYRA